MLKKCSFPYFFLFLFFFIFSLEASETPTYRIHDLGTLAAEKSEALKINNEGKVFGTVHADKPSFFIWDEKEGIKMFPFPLQDAIIEKVNNCGQTIMKHEKETGWIFSAKVKEYYFWDPINDQFYQIIPPNKWETEFVITSLNDQGQFVIVDPNPNLHPRDRMSAYWDGSAYHFVDKKIMDTVVKITNGGVLFGYSVKKYNDDRTIVIYHPEKEKIVYLPFFPFFEKTDSEYSSLFRIFYTDKGILAFYHRYHFRPSFTCIQETQESYAKIISGFKIESINSYKQAVGWKEEEKIHFHPAYWNGEDLFELNKICTQDKEPTWKKIETVLDINDHQQIVGIGLTKKGKTHAILLSPDFSYNFKQNESFDVK